MSEYVMIMSRLYAWRSVVSWLHLGGSRPPRCRTEQHHLHSSRARHPTALPQCMRMYRLFLCSIVMLALLAQFPAADCSSFFSSRSFQRVATLRLDPSSLARFKNISALFVHNPTVISLPHRLPAAMCSVASRTSHSVCSTSAPASSTSKMAVISTYIPPEEFAGRLWAIDSGLSTALGSPNIFGEFIREFIRLFANRVANPE
jgi:hypothetical protein